MKSSSLGSGIMASSLWFCDTNLEAGYNWEKGGGYNKMNKIINGDKTDYFNLFFL